MRVALIALGLVLTLAGPVSAGDQVPFRGTMSGTAAIKPLDPPIVSVLLQTSGNATQLGRFTLEAPHVVNQATMTAVGTYVFTAASGATLTATLSGSASMVAPGVLAISETATITRGTGRFADATGSFSTERTFFLTTGETHGTFQGWISTPGN